MRLSRGWSSQGPEYHRQPRLDMTACGDAPRVEEWQSVRKCTKARPTHEDLEAAVPQADEGGRAFVNPDGTVPVEPIDEDDDEPGESRYLIERILRAEPRGRGWVVYVKWRDYDDVTAEPVSSIVRDTRGDPDILNQIHEAQQRYRDEHPVRVPADGSDLPPAREAREREAPVRSAAGDRPAPTRILPSRRARPTQFHLQHVVCPAYRDVAHLHALRARARACMHPE